MEGAGAGLDVVRARDGRDRGDEGDARRGDVAHAETYYLFVAMNPDGTDILAGGRYIDRFERRDGEWKLAVRSNLIEWSSVLAALDNPLAGFPGIDDNGVAARSKDDISYRRPLTNRRERNVPKFD